MSTSLNINRQNGNVPKSLPGEDHITGLVIYMAAADIPESFKAERVQPLSTIDAAEAAGIVDYTTAADGTQTAAPWAVRVLHYHLSELYRINPAISLYVGIFEKPQTDTLTFAEIKTVQNFADGRIRQIGVWCGDRVPSEDDLVAIQGQADTLEAEGAELSVVYAPKVANVKQISTKLAGGNKCRISVVIGQAGSGTGAELYKDKANAAKASVSGLGVVLGLISKAKVHQCIAWVKEFPTGISLPAFGDGTLLRDMDKALVEQLDTARYLFFVTQQGQSGSYMNDSHTMDSATSDYASIESVRTMDKGARGVRAYLIPELGGNVYVDADTGKLASYTVAHLETVAGHALEDMEKAGELSGYKAEIDPDQDVAASSTVDIVLKKVAVPVMRHVRIKIGFAKTV
ncbi:MAG TPA: DUF2586 family protein [Alloprevotella sp.]|uniref:DUF2586 family protein n=3 Tax=Bacteroidales TaxID=171549 RepID=A0A3L7Z9N1_9BACE|nr:DUF2586 family protein [Bacteroides acidifaciens]NBH91356.1 DUF2586 family protein [Muribaculaceae bacterium S4]NBI19679.1 DUF2586 family protein [Muribaculaceae bacterium Z1]DAM15436.1 MAG TPA: tail sheath protein [Caudoviricetes sp.]HRF86552.1 DUF2586 family protein [Alloprevotella sp.]RLT80888.1 DUF2586 family protein [Bacteroides acidifaciens]